MSVKITPVRKNYASLPVFKVNISYFGSNIGIIQDPLTDHAKLVAATGPIPMGLGNDLVLSSDDKFLTVSYPGVGLGVGEWGNALQAPLNSDPLIGILNGDFDTQADWSTRGAANILNSQAILTVTDTHGASTVETLLLNVINVAPIVNPGADITTTDKI